MSDPACWKDADWYRVKWNLAAQHTNALASPDHAGGVHGPAARRHADDLVNAAARTTEALDRWSRRGRHRDLIRFLAGTVEPAGVILLAGVLVETVDTEREHAAGGAIKDRRALIGARADLDAVAPGALLAYALGRSPTTYRVSYNAACYLSTLVFYDDHMGGAPDWFRRWAYPQRVDDVEAEALGRLREAIRRAPAGKRGELAGWARKDPSLRALREGRGDEFDDATSEATVERRESALGARRPRLRPLLEAQRQYRWDMSTVQELWSYALEDAKTHSDKWAAFDRPENWKKELDRLSAGGS